MPLYFLLGTLTTEGRAKVHRNRDLVVESTRRVSIAGAEILGQYAVLGRYDYVMIGECDEAIVPFVKEMLSASTGFWIIRFPAL